MIGKLIKKYQKNLSEYVIAEYAKTRSKRIVSLLVLREFGYEDLFNNCFVDSTMILNSKSLSELEKADYKTSKHNAKNIGRKHIEAYFEDVKKTYEGKREILVDDDYTFYFIC